ncbi:MAG: hypothetical protein JWR05_616 [Mucilaginibacter sp.]|nr:hypothetical protein [Mucilaginibacter sp.]
MRHVKFLSVTIMLSMIAISTMSWKPFHKHHKVKPVTITAVYDFSTFPNVSGTFTTGGALSISGTSTMNVHPYNNGTKAHCVVILVTSKGTITIHQQCNLAANHGRWEIVKGTGCFEDLKGHGSLTMPPNTEAMTGVISRNKESEDHD